MTTTILFLAFGAVLVASSLLVILHKNPVTSALVGSPGTELEFAL